MIAQQLLETGRRLGQQFCERGTQTCYNTDLPTVAASSSNVKVVLQIIFGIIGTVALIYLLYSAIQFITSQGEPQGISKARQGIIYAIVGLVVALSAELIVTLLLERI